MPFPFAEAVSLTSLQRAQLEALVRAGSTPQALVFRCRLVLRAADKDQPTNLQIAVEFDCDRHTVARWRNRYLKKGLAGLQDAPRSVVLAVLTRAYEEAAVQRSGSGSSLSTSKKANETMTQPSPIVVCQTGNTSMRA